MSFSPEIYGIHAAARVDADVNPALVNFAVNTGFASVVRTGAGAYTLTPVVPFDTTRMIALVTQDEADARGSVACRFVNNTLQVTNVDNAGVDVDRDFNVFIIKIRAP